MRKSGTSFNDSADYGTLTLTRANHNNGATTAGSNLYFQLKDSGGTLREYAGIGGRKTEAGAAGGALYFYRYNRAELGYWNSTGLFADALYDRNNTGFYVNPADGGFNLRGGTSNRVTFSTNDSGFLVVNAEGNGVSDVRLGAAYGQPGIYSSTYLSLGSGGSYTDFRFSNNQVGSINSSGGR
jgi:hypothetical protein